MSLAGIAAEILVALKKVVTWLALKLTTDFASKFAPSIVSVKAAPPASCGVRRADIAGIGLFESLIVKTWGAEGPAFGAGFVTVMLAEPAVAISDAKIAAQVACIANKCSCPARAIKLHGGTAHKAAAIDRNCKRRRPCRGA